MSAATGRITNNGNAVLASMPALPSGRLSAYRNIVYDIFGPGENLAARMETLSDSMEITLCDDMYELIQHDFRVKARGEEEIKGGGQKQIYTLIGPQDPRR